eukprot:m.228384 g.228384  ORF g.228384 m.228384 type:complete len:708 (-) comp11735_c0_seq1:96-2219(-)
MSSNKSPTKKGEAPPENFWTEGGHRRVVRRIDEGAAYLDTISKLVHERAAVERKHARSLLDWAKRWDQRLHRAPSFKDGTLESAVRGMLTEAETTAGNLLTLEKDLHTEVRETLLKWKKQNYPRFLGRTKAARKAGSEFDKARKPYEKALGEENKKKNSYFAAAAKAFELEQRIVAAKQYSTPTSQKDIAALETELGKTKAAAAKYKQAYEENLAFRRTVTETYRKAMGVAFQNCQNLEKTRIEFLMHVLAKYQNLMGAAQAKKVSETDQALGARIAEVQPEADLAMYSAKHGIDMPFEAQTEPAVWTPGQGAPVADESALAAPGSLPGQWFTKLAEKHGRSHKRFFVFDERTKQITYYEKLVRGLPEKAKGAIRLADVKAVEVKGALLTLVTPLRRWELTSPKNEKLIEEWAQRLAGFLGLPVTRAAGTLLPPGAPVVAAAVVPVEAAAEEGEHDGEHDEHGNESDSGDEHSGIAAAALAGGALAAGAGAVLSGAGTAVRPTSGGPGGHAAGAAGSSFGMVPPVTGGHFRSGPNPPVRFVVHERGPSHVLLTWREPVGVAVGAYKLYQDGISAPIFSAKAQSHRVDGLHPETQHEFRLHAVSPDSKTSSPAYLRINTLSAGAPVQVMEIDPATANYEAHHHTAATKIQAGFRGRQARQHAADLRVQKSLSEKEYTQEHHDAARTIQAGFRGYSVRKALDGELGATA